MAITQQSSDGSPAPSRPLLASSLVFLLVATYLLPVAPLGLNVYDEGVRLYGAQRVLAGDLPYHDFFAYYGPGQFYWPAVLFKLFGERILVARLGAVLFIALAAAAAFALCRRARLGLSLSLLPAVAVVLPLNSGELLTSCDPALSLVLVAGAMLTGADGWRPRYFVSGVILGLATLFRHDFGAYGSVAAMVTASRIEWSTLPTVRRSEVETSVRQLGSLVAGIAAMTIPAYGLLALRDPWVVFRMLIVVPLKMMPYRTLPYFSGLPSIQSLPLAGDFSSAGLKHTAIVLILGTPLLAGAFTAALLIPRIRHRVFATPERATALSFLLVAAAGFSIYSLGRSGGYHVYPIHVLSVCVISLVGPSCWPFARRLSPLAGPVFAATIGFLLGVMLAGSTANLTEASGLNVLGASRIIVNDRLAWIPSALDDIRTYGDGGPIFVAMERHDRVHWNALILYVLSHRKSGTYFHDFIPGVTTTQAVQERIIADLQRNNVQTVVVWKTVLPDEPNKSRVSSGVYLLDTYLQSEFAPVRQSRAYDVLVRRH